MIFSNPVKMDILMGLENPFDFNAFRARCMERGLSIVGSLSEYAQKVGMVRMSLVQFPDRTPFEAYMMFVSDATVNNRFAYDSSGNQVEASRGPGCCGGGIQR